jgi:transcriptional regulator GlxA family with amidase domain
MNPRTPKNRAFFESSAFVKGQFAKLKIVKDWPVRAERLGYSVSALAADCGISVRQLQRFFEIHFGQKPKQWLKRQRLRRALEMLRQGCSVKEAAIVLGYSSAAHFSNDFTAGFQVPPSAACLIPEDQVEMALAE